MTLEDFENMLEPAKNAKVAIAIDWLTVLFLIDDKVLFPPAAEHDEVRQLSDVITVKNYGKGNEHYKYIWHVLYNGEHAATLLTHTRNSKFVKEGNCKIDFKNHLLYSSTLWPCYDAVVAALKLKYKNVGRVDIAIDGLNYLQEFMNAYVRQTAKDKVVEMKGRAKINCKVLDRKTMMYQNFNIGDGKSPKYITIYNKSLDIAKTGKAYIQDYWLANGITKEVLPIELLAKALAGDNEKMYLDGYENLFRFEIRLKGAKFLEMQQFNIHYLRNTDTLVSLVKRHCEKFFEFVGFTRTDVSKCDNLVIMPYHLFNIEAITLTRMKPKDDLYKTKLSIKKNVRQLYLGNLQVDDGSVRDMLMFDITNFELHHWFTKRLSSWVKEFEPINPNRYEAKVVTRYLDELRNELNPETPKEATDEVENFDEIGLEEAPF